MKITMTYDACKWYQEELDLEKDANVRFFVRYGGVGGQIPGFSLGIKEAVAENIHTSININGITFFIEEEDVWYFEGKDLLITFDQDLKEPRFTYNK